MSESSWYTWVAAGMALVVVVGLVAGLGLGSGYGTRTTGSSGASGSNGPVYLYLTIAFNPVNGMDQYFPANFSVPAHTLVHVVITNYDDGVNLVPAEYAQVRGVVGGTISWANASMVSPETASSIGLDQISHTFTLNAQGYALNVPVPAATDVAHPTTVAFATYFNTTGVFDWNCMAPCDPGSMATLGYMAGAVTVEAA